MCYSWYAAWGTAPAHAARDSPKAREYVQRFIDEADVLVLFNAKFDLSWLQKCGLQFHDKKIYDCQLAEFILERQQNSYPSLEGAATKYNLGHKLDIIKTEYWAKGINTDAIPWAILREYAIQDAALTYNVYLAQQEVLTPIQKRLLSVQCQDLLVLQQMEWNGIVYDAEACEREARRIDDEISTLKTDLSNIYPNVPINFSSGDNLSAFLYGGVVKEYAKEHVGFFKSGKQMGQPKYKNIVIEHALPQLFKPLRGSELKKEGFYGTSENLLKQLRGSAKAKQHVNRILELSKLEKLNGTYYRGLPALNETMNWPASMLHGTINPCVAATGRLSASRPNQQNFSNEILNVFPTRFK